MIYYVTLAKGVMMQCEICGFKGELVKAKVEGVILDVCKSCSELGEVVEIPKNNKVKREKGIFDDERILREDFGDKLREERIKKGMDLEGLANLIKEKVSVIKRIEQNELMPDEKILKKLRKYFDFEFYEEIPSVRIKESKEEKLTVGDVVELRE